MIVECIDARGARYKHIAPDELSPREAMERLGVYRGPWTVYVWPNGKPAETRCVQTHRVSADGNRTVTEC